MAPITNLMKKKKILYLDHKVPKSLGLNQVEVHGSTNFNTSKFTIGVHVHTNASLLVVGAMLANNPIGKYD